MKAEVVETPRRESAYTRRMFYFVLFLIIALVLPLSVYRNFVALREVADSPYSRVLLFGEPADPLEMAARLNPDGVPIYMHEILAHASGDGCSGAADPALPRGRQTVVTFLVDDAQRQAVVYVPNSYPGDPAAAPTPVAMLVLYHGLNDNCEHFLNATGFLPYAEQHGFIVVSACGSQGYLGTAWNSGMCCGFSDDKPNDVGFAQEIVREMGEAMCIDPRKVMAVGFSNGAMLAEVLACEAPDVYRAAVSIGGVVELRPGNEEGLAHCTEKVQTKLNRTSVLMVHGNSDVMVPWGGNKLLGFPSVPANVAAWAGRNDCAANSTTTTIATKTYTNTIYTQCNPHATMNLWVADVAPFKDYAENDQDVSVAECEEVEDDVVVDQEKVAAVVQPPPQRNQLVRLDIEELSVTKQKHKKAHGPHEHHKPPHHNDDDDDDDKDDDDAEKHRKKSPAPKHHKKPHEEKEREEDEEEEEAHHHHHHHHKKHEGGKHGKHHVPGDDHHGKHGKGHHHPHGHPHAPPPPPPHETERAFIDPATIAADSGVSQIELVKVEGGGHRWPEDDEFSTTDYIIAFGARVMNGYN